MNAEGFDEVVLHRLDKLESSVQRLHDKIDEKLTKEGEIEIKLATMGVFVEGLVKSRDRLISGMSVLATGVCLLFAEQFFNLF